MALFPWERGGVPERPNGTALKAVTDRNASRGFKSRPLCQLFPVPSGADVIYRLDRRFVLQAIGVNLLIAGLASWLALVAGTLWLALLGLAVAVAMMGRGAMLWFRPPVVARTAETGIVLGGPLTVKRVEVVWTDVEGVSFDEQRFYLDRGEKLLAFPMAYAGGRGPELLRDVYDRLNTAHGYERFDLE